MTKNLELIQQALGTTSNDNEESVSETPLEVSPNHPLLNSVAQEDLTIIQEVFESRNACQREY